MKKTTTSTFVNLYGVGARINSKMETNNVEWDNRTSELFAEDLAMTCLRNGGIKHYMKILKDCDNTGFVENVILIDILKDCDNTGFVENVIPIDNIFTWMLHERHPAAAEKLCELYYKLLDIVRERDDASEIMAYLD